MSESTEPKRREENTGQLVRKHKYIYDFSELDGEMEFRSRKNKLIIRGRVTEELRYSHGVKYGKYYKMSVRVRNRSGRKEPLPIIVSETLIEEWMIGNLKGKKVEVKGQLRSYDITTQEGVRYSKTIIFVTSKIQVYGEGNLLEKDAIRNQIYIDGYVCKEPICRETIYGIKYTKIIAAISGDGTRKDYIACMFWNENASIAEKWKAGERFKIYGIIRNRKRLKKHLEGLKEVDFVISQDVSVIKVAE